MNKYFKKFFLGVGLAFTISACNALEDGYNVKDGSGKYIKGKNYQKGSNL